MTSPAPAIILYLRAALPGWTVTEIGGHPVAEHPNGSRMRWECKFNNGNPTWVLFANDAVRAKYPEEVELLATLRPAPIRRTP